MNNLLSRVAARRSPLAEGSLATCLQELELRPSSSSVESRYPTTFSPPVTRRTWCPRPLRKVEQAWPDRLTERAGRSWASPVRLYLTTVLRADG